MEVDLSAPVDTDAPAVVSFKDHTKYVVCIKWSMDGQLLATVSHDKSVNLYRNRYVLELAFLCVTVILVSGA